VTRTPKFPSESARLFADAPSTPPAGVYVANIDGASRGNPGPAAYAVVIRDPNGNVILELGKRLGRDTNNVAEYYALLAALDYVASSGIKALHERAVKLSRQLAYFTIEHVRRELNREADALANAALDSGVPISHPTPATATQHLPNHHRKSSPVPRRIRARFEQGVFVPVDAPDLPDGSDVFIEIHPRQK
jgi:ribonuclease HI